MHIYDRKINSVGFGKPNDSATKNYEPFITT